MTERPLSIAQTQTIARLARKYGEDGECADELKVVRLDCRGQDVDVVLRRPDGREQALFPSGRLGMPRDAA